MTKGDITPKQIRVLNKLYHKKAFFVGRDRLWSVAKRFEPQANISQRDTMQYLRTQDVWQTHTRNQMKKGNVAPIYAGKPSYCQVNLKFYPEESGYIGVLNCVDVFTKFFITYPIRDKTAKELADECKVLPKKITTIQSDQGKEFLGEFAELLRKASIKQVFSKSHTPQSNGVIERFNQTQARLLYKAVSQGYKLTEMLDKVMSNMNVLPNETTKQAPVDLEMGNAEVQNKAAEMIRNRISKQFGAKQKGSELEKGQLVRILKPT